MSPHFPSQILLGHKYFKEEFGSETSDFMIPDCFGFPYSLPSILSHAGLRGFSTQKLTWESANGILYLCNRKDLMGEYKNNALTNILLVLILLFSLINMTKGIIAV